MIRALLTVAGLLLTASQVRAQAQAPFVLVDDANSIKPAFSFDYRFDPTGTTGIAEMLGAEFSGRAIATDALRLDGAVLWVRFALTNNTAFASWVAFPPSVRLHERIDLYVVSPNGDIQESAAGSLLPAQQRSVQSTLAALNFQQQPATTSMVYLRFQTTGAVSVNFDILEEGAFSKHNAFDLRLRSAFLGILLLIGVIALALGVQQRSALFLTYSAYCLMNVVNHVVAQGDWDLLVATAQPYRGAWMVRTTTPLTAISALLFYREFIGGRRAIPRIARAIDAFVAIQAAVAVVALLGFADFADRLVWGTLMFAAIFLGVLSIAAVRMKVPRAKYLLAGWLPYLTWVLVVYCARSGYMHLDQYFGLIIPARYNILVGFVLRINEILFLSLGLIRYLREMEERRIKAEEASKDREQLMTLVRVISHDITNPLMVIKALNNSAKKKNRDPVNEAISSALDRMGVAAGHINDIIKGVRAMVSLRDGKAFVHKDPVVVADVANIIRSTFENRIETKHQILEVTDVSPALLVQGDAVVLTHNVLANLVSNAIKFSPEGATISIQIADLGTEVRIGVRDHGIGIPLALIPHLFSLEQSVSRRGTAGEAGTGYGLPIVKTYVEAMSGRIEVTSRSAEDGPGETGSMFMVFLKKMTTVTPKVREVS